MKRSEVNAVIRRAEAHFRSRSFHLPPFASWTPADWRERSAAAGDIVETGLGWDVTDFGSGDFAGCGLAIVTLRNGRSGNLGTGRGKVYCEKIAILEEGQVCPSHTHRVKVEDIINRDTAPLAVTLHASADGGRSADAVVAVMVDGLARTLPAGGTVVLGAGESITLEPGCYHRLAAPAGRVMFGEVSVVNDDLADNRFADPVGRFPPVEEDEPPYRLLVQDYAAWCSG
jgi:D-lyxose ketol-isomerase